MLAEIFLLKLEFLLQQRAARRAVSDRARFVPVMLPFRFGAAAGRA